MMLFEPDERQKKARPGYGLGRFRRSQVSHISTYVHMQHCETYHTSRQRELDSTLINGQIITKNRIIFLLRRFPLNRHCSSVPGSNRLSVTKDKR